MYILNLIIRIFLQFIFVLKWTYVSPLSSPFQFKQGYDILWTNKDIP